MKFCRYYFLDTRSGRGRSTLLHHSTIHMIRRKSATLVDGNVSFVLMKLRHWFTLKTNHWNSILMTSPKIIKPQLIISHIFYSFIIKMSLYLATRPSPAAQVVLYSPYTLNKLNVHPSDPTKPCFWIFFCYRCICSLIFRKQWNPPWDSRLWSSENTEFRLSSRSWLLSHSQIRTLLHSQTLPKTIVTILSIVTFRGRIVPHGAVTSLAWPHSGPPDPVFYHHSSSIILISNTCFHTLLGCH